MRPSLPCSCPDEDRRGRALLWLASSAALSRRAPERRAPLLRLHHLKRRATIAGKHPDCGLLRHRATSERFRRRSFALEPSFRPRARDATGRRTRPDFCRRGLDRFRVRGIGDIDGRVLFGVSCERQQFLRGVRDLQRALPFVSRGGC